MMKISVRVKWQLLRTRLYLERLHPRMFFLPAIIFLLSTLVLTLYYSLFQFTDFWERWGQANGYEILVPNLGNKGS